jgi:metal-responsive CopG/Arc/MetJ family transcriptional regulator
MNEDKKLIGIYLPISLIKRLSIFIHNLFINKNTKTNQSEVIEKALVKYLDEEEKK